MNVNGISNQTNTYAAYKSTEQKAAATETEGKQTEVSAVYEPSAETEKNQLKCDRGSDEGLTIDKKFKRGEDKDESDNNDASGRSFDKGSIERRYFQ